MIVVITEHMNTFLAVSDRAHSSTPVLAACLMTQYRCRSLDPIYLTSHFSIHTDVCTGQQIVYCTRKPFTVASFIALQAGQACLWAA